MALHARHEHDAGDPHAQHHEEGIDQPSDGGVVSTRTAWAQQARSTATKARNLQGKTHVLNVYTILQKHTLLWHVSQSYVRNIKNVTEWLVSVFWSVPDSFSPVYRDKFWEQTFQWNLSGILYIHHLYFSKHTGFRMTHFQCLLNMDLWQEYEITVTIPRSNKNTQQTKSLTANLS